jgi:hypothetical protein
LPSSSLSARDVVGVRQSGGTPVRP